MHFTLEAVFATHLCSVSGGRCQKISLLNHSPLKLCLILNTTARPSMVHIFPRRLRMIKKLAGLVLMLVISCCPALAKKGKWKVLFDGKSTDAWRGFRQDSFPDKTWKVEGET